MQKILLRGIIAVLLLLVVIGIAAKLAVSSNSREPASVSGQTSTPLYTLSQYEGRIALYKSGYAMPVEIYDVFLDELPPDEQSVLISGITANTDEEAQRLIEDYTS